MISILILDTRADRSSEFCQLIKGNEWLEVNILQVNNESCARQALAKQDYDLLVMGGLQSDYDAIDVCGRLSQQYTRLAVLLLEHRFNLPTLELGVGSGAQDCIFIENIKNEPCELAKIILVSIIRKQNEGLLSHLSEQLATYDNLIGIPNAFLFEERLKHLICIFSESTMTTDRVPFVLAKLGLGRLDIVAESLGQGMKDLLLVSAAARLKDYLRSSDTIARLSEHNFGILIESGQPNRLDAQFIFSKLVRLVDVMEQPFDLLKGEARITCSIGVCSYADDVNTVKEMMTGMETAFSQAKREGGSCCRFYSPALNRIAEQRSEMANALSQAVSADALTLYFQPMLNAAGTKVTCAEALLRWQMKDGQWVNPEVVVSMAIEMGLMGRLGSWVLKQACLCAVKIQQQGFVDFRIAVNVSSCELGEPEYSQRVLTILHKSGLNPASLELEITESQMMENLDVTMTNLNALKEEGIGVSVDDFGTGHSSLEYLSKLPLNRLKIDRSFVRNLPDNDEEKTIAIAIIGLAHQLKLQIVAEGIEQQSQLEFLRQYLAENDEIQGYYYSKPLPMNEFQTYISSYSAP